jgi:hypothetical protein
MADKQKRTRGVDASKKQDYQFIMPFWHVLWAELLSTHFLRAK